ncbi:hypothetical protein MJD09_26700, partial [bacterium]|nr:hypothetical protein [bacterium]
RIPQPDLWWPNGYGEQRLYKVTVKTDHDEAVKQIGFRTLQVVTPQDERGIGLIFKVNDKEIFCKGANWIPMEALPGQENHEAYTDLLESAVAANMNMIRVWGGGIYEEDIFYQLCDELGLLVWQDFMFACGAYPEHEEFLQNISEEVKQNVRRLQHHPCLALWCGNNENEWNWFKEQRQPVQLMPGFTIFHELIPNLLQQLDPLRPYWPSSPFGDEEDPNSESSGNRHQWDVWSLWVDYEQVRTDRSLFVSEFGFQGPADAATLEKVIPEEQRYPQSRLFEFHNKQVEGNERLFRFLAGHLPVVGEWEDFIYLTQLNQALALQTCVHHWRSRWPQCAGAIIWQLNDCWPVTSWSLIDSDCRQKAAYYFAKRFFAPQTIAAKWMGQELIFQGVNHSAQTWDGHVEIFRYHTLRNELTPLQQKPVRLDPQSVHTIVSLKPRQELSKPEKYVWLCRLGGDTSLEIIRSLATRLPFKHLNLNLKRPTLKLSVLANRQDQIEFQISADTLALFVQMSHPALQFQQNWFDLWPGEEKIIVAKKHRDGNLKADEIKITCLNQFLQQQPNR